MLSRRRFLTATGAAACGAFAGSFPQRSDAFASDAPAPTFSLFDPGEYRRIDATERTFHVSSAIDMFEQYDGLLDIWASAGVTDAWFCCWFYGYFPYPWEKCDFWLGEIKKVGIRPHLIAVPFCHGGGALDPRNGDFPNLPPERWKIAKRWNGSENWGYSWHSPAEIEGAEAIRTLYRRYGRFDYFLDDDFRFANSPGDVGGCVCPECRAGFLKAAGLGENRWEETLDDLRGNADTPLLRAWCDYFCARLKTCFDAYRAAVPEVDLGIMIMRMGCERSGIGLDDYRDALVRVGEEMFSDATFAPAKNKTLELFSVLLHRRFCKPGRAFSETTVYPEGTLSAENMASKLSISTISDVRNTCFMSGLRAIPPTYWPILADRMEREKAIHSRLLGQKPTGPFKHYYGKAARYLGGDVANSLFLGIGVPFEVCDAIPADGWTFLSDADAAEIERGAAVGADAGSRLLARFESTSGRFSKVDENLDALFAFRRSILPRLQTDKIPYVEEEIPIVLAWYPDAKAVYLWNLTEKNVVLNLRRGTKKTTIELADRGSALVDEAAFV